MEKTTNRLYSIQSLEGYGFYTGLTPKSEQVLMGLFCQNLIALRFDVDGSLLGVEQRQIPFFQGVAPPYNICGDQLQPLIDEWKKEMPLTDAAIKVKKFMLGNHDVFIEDYPSHFHEILSDPDVSDEEKADIFESIKIWDEDGQFVLQWGNDFWLDETGEVVSS